MHSQHGIRATDLIRNGRRPSRRCSFWWVAVLLCVVFTPVLGQSVTLNLRDADITALIGTVAEVTGRNFIVDPRVKGKVTVISSHSLTQEEVYQVFLSALRVHGFVAVPSGDVIKITPETSGRADSIPLATSDAPGQGDELVTRVLPIQHVPADQLVPVLRPLVPQQGHLAAYPPSNSLIVSDRAANVSRLMKIIERIDVSSGSEIEVVVLEHATAGEVVRILEALEPQARQDGSGVAPAKLVADERTNSVLISGDPASRLRLRAVISHLDTPLDDGGNTHVVYLKYANAADLVPILEGVTTSVAEGKGETAQSADVAARTSIHADESVNALVITTSPAFLRSLKGVIRQLDIRRAQVLVEAVIAEVSNDKATDLGIQWRTTKTPNSTGVFGGTNFSGAGGNINQLSLNPLAPVSGLNLGFIDGTFTFRGEEFLNIGVLVTALAADVDTNILSTPSLVTMDNQEAEIVIAQNVPFITGSFTTNVGATEGSVNPFQTIEREDVGIILRVTPQINEGDTIKLEVKQEVSSLTPSVARTATGASDLITNKRSIKTSVMVDDRKMLVLGGLIDDDLKETAEKVPVLGDIPLLGRLFRFDSVSKVKRNLMVFLRPTILHEENQELVSSAKYNYIRARQLAERETGILLMPDEEAPLMMELLDELRTPPPELPPAGSSRDDAGTREIRSMAVSSK